MDKDNRDKRPPTLFFEATRPHRLHSQFEVSLTKLLNSQIGKQSRRNVDHQFWPLCAAVILLLSNIPRVDASTLPFQTLSQGISSGYQSAATLVVRDNVTWQTLWNNLTAIEAPPQRPPTPDFTKSMVVAAMMGPQPTCSNSIQVNSISVRNSEIQINITKIYGRDGDFPCPTDISPYHVVQTQRIDGPATTIVTIQSGTNRGAPVPAPVIPALSLTSALLVVSLLLAAITRASKRRRETAVKGASRSTVGCWAPTS